MIELKATDVKMLRILLEDGRTSFKEIAEKINTSEDVVLAHFRELLKAGLIIGATAQINYQTLGYTGIATTLLRVDAQNLKNTMDRFAKIPNIGHWLFYCYGSSYNIAIISVLKNLRDLEQLKQTIYKQNKITASQTFIWMDVRNTPENIFENFSEYKNKLSTLKDLRSNTKKFKIDEFDIKIIKILSVNGRLPFNKIAEEIGLSTQTVARRYKLLRDNNVIRILIQIKPSMLGYQVWTEFDIALTDPNEIDRVANELSKIQGVQLVIKTNGNFDLAVQFLLKSFNDLICAQKRIYEISSIKRIENYFVEAVDPLPTRGEITSTF